MVGAGGRPANSYPPRFKYIGLGLPNTPPLTANGALV